MLLNIENFELNEQQDIRYDFPFETPLNLKVLVNSSFASECVEAILSSYN